MSTNFREFSSTARRLNAALGELEAACGLLQLDPLQDREWYQLLTGKLLPQLRDDAFLVVAVAGGTNIGKSVVFNHIAGGRASATSPQASGTRHPVCLMPPDFAEEHDLESIFEGFSLHRWESSDDPMHDSAEHRLFWQPSQQTPANLLVLDTPDIDSDAPINWQRADRIRRCADVLIAVLTQQKYNDAAVKQFFRRSAAEDKAVVVVFNQCELPEDDKYWPLWLGTFVRETGVEPEFVYIAPSDRKAAEENRLGFYERPWPADAPKVDGDGAGTAGFGEARNLAADLSRLRFAEIKLRSLRGSLRHLLDAESGVPEYLADIDRRSGEFRAAAERLSSESAVQVRNWPTVPNKLVVREVREWWKSRREGWARGVQSVYDTVGWGVSWPFRAARNAMRGEPEPPLDVYRKREWSAVIAAVEEVFEKLAWLSESGSPLLRPNFRRLLEGQSRSELLERLRAEHARVDLEAELTEAVNREMQTFQQDSPELYRFYRQLNNISTAVRPMTSVVMFTLGWGPAGELVAPVVADAAAQAVAHVAADFAGGTATAIAGEQAVSGAAGRGMGLLQTKFQKLQAAFAAGRAAWLIEQLKTMLLGSLPEELQRAAAVPDSEPYREVERTLEVLEQQLQREYQETPAVGD